MTFCQPGDPGCGPQSPKMTRKQKKEAFAPGAGLALACPLPSLVGQASNVPVPPPHPPRSQHRSRQEGASQKQGAHSSCPGPCVQAELLSGWETLQLRPSAVISSRTGLFKWKLTRMK